MIGLLARFRRRQRRRPRPFEHDTDWHGDLDDVRAELTTRRAKRAMRRQERPDDERGQP